MYDTLANPPRSRPAGRLSKSKGHQSLLVSAQTRLRYGSFKSYLISAPSSGFVRTRARPSTNDSSDPRHHSEHEGAFYEPLKVSRRL